MTLPKRILVVDDDAAVREALRQVFIQESYQVVAAATNEEALQQANDHEIDLVVLGSALANQDNWRTFDKLRRGTLHPPVILMTSRPLEPADGCPLDAVAWMAKPLDLPQLLETVREMMSPSGTSAGDSRSRTVRGRTGA